MILFGYLSAFLSALPPPRCTSMCQETLLVHWINVVLKQHNWEQNRYLLHNSQASRVFVFFALAIAAETFEYNFLEYKFFAEKGFVWVLVMLVTLKLLASLTRREVNLKSFPGIDFLQMRIFKIAFHWDGVREAIQTNIPAKEQALNFAVWNGRSAAQLQWKMLFMLLNSFECI